MSIQQTARDYLDAVNKRDILIANRVDEREKRDAAITKIAELDTLINSQRVIVQTAKDALIAELNAPGG